jgi:membrane protein implicated in regulation of membrane protease activity
MESQSIWLLAAATWILILASYFVASLDLNLIIFLILIVLVFAAVTSWSVSKSEKPKRKKIRPSNLNLKAGNP